MANDSGETEIYKNRLTLVRELAEKLGEKVVVIQCPICGDPHKKIPVNELSLEVVSVACSEECKKKLDMYNLPVEILA